MPSLRCSMCGISWPLDDQYKKCPGCTGKTDPVGNVEPDFDDDEARSHANHLIFERKYADWDESRPAERLSTAGLPDYEPASP